MSASQTSPASGETSPTVHESSKMDYPKSELEKNLTLDAKFGPAPPDVKSSEGSTQSKGDHFDNKKSCFCHLSCIMLILAWYLLDFFILFCFKFLGYVAHYRLLFSPKLAKHCPSTLKFHILIAYPSSGYSRLSVDNLVFANFVLRWNK